MVVELLIAVLAFLAGFALARGRGGGRGRQVYHLNLDPSLPVLHRCREVDAGVELAGGVLITHILIDRVVELGGLRLYISAMDRVAMAHEKTLQKGRKAVVALSGLTGSGGDVLFYLQAAAAAAVLAAAFFVYSSNAQMRSTLDRQTQTLEQVRSTVNGLMVVPK